MIGLYNNVTMLDAGKQTGTLISASNKLTVVLNSSLSEQKDIWVAIRTIAEDHKTVGATTLAFEGTHADKWSFASLEDDNVFLGWGEPLVIEEEIRNSNKILKIRVKCLENESVMSDVSTSIKITSTIGTVA